MPTAQARLRAVIPTLGDADSSDVAARTHCKAGNYLKSMKYLVPNPCANPRFEESESMRVGISDMTDAELAALEVRMIAAAPIVLEAVANGDDRDNRCADNDEAGDAEDSPPDALACPAADLGFVRGLTR